MALQSLVQDSIIAKANRDIEVDDDEETTDIGQGSSSDSESASGVSCYDGDSSMSKRCRFGKTVLETIPATPSHGSRAAFPRSPPGLSRTSMRQARDACKPTEPIVNAYPSAIGTNVANNVSRFGASKLETVPKTPVGGAKVKAYKSIFGSPPGLSRAEQRRARDACKMAAPASMSWGTSSAVPNGKMPPLTVGLGGKPAHHEALVRIKREAALLSELKAHTADTSESSGEEMLGADHDSSSEAESFSKVCVTKHTGQRCHFGTTPLGTIPSAPASVAPVPR